MKLIVERTDLLGALQRVSGIVMRRATIPILANVLVEADNGALTIRATDLDMEAVVTATAAIETAGKITVPAATLLDIARALPDGAQIAMTLDGERLAVTSGRSRWKLPTLPATQFPELKPEKWDFTADMKAADLADILTRTVWCVTTDANKQNGHGVNVAIGGGKMTAAAWRGPQLAIAEMPTDGEHAALTIPTKMVQEIVKACGEDAIVTLTASERKIGIVTPGFQVTSKIIAMPFVDYAGLVTMDRGASFTVDSATLIGAVRRAVIAADQVTDGRGIRLSLSGTTLAITGRTAHSEAADEIEVEYDGPDASIGVESASLIEMMGAIRGETAVVEFVADRPVPILVHGADDRSVVTISALMKVAK